MYSGPTIPVDVDFNAAFEPSGERSPPLMINIHVIDNETDKEEKVIQISLRKLKFSGDIDNNSDVARYKNQKQALDNKVQSILKLLIWAMNNNRTLEFVNAREDKE